MTHSKSIRLSPTTRMWRYVTKEPTHWLFDGALTHNGYGVVSGENGHGLRRAHRLAWEEAMGPIPAGMLVLHTCDVRNCVRNDEVGTYLANGALHPRAGHLWLGTNTDNAADKVAKQRHRTKITAFHVQAIRACQDVGMGAAEIARTLNIAFSTVNSVTAGKTWRHVE